MFLSCIFRGTSGGLDSTLNAAFREDPASDSFDDEDHDLVSEWVDFISLFFFKKWHFGNLTLL